MYFHVNFCSKLDCDAGTVVPLARACRSRCEQDGGRRDGWRICNRFYVRPYRPSGAARNQINKTSIGDVLEDKEMQELINEYMVANRVICLIPPGLLIKSKY